MRSAYFLVAAMMISSACWVPSVKAGAVEVRGAQPVPAFPGAEGFGRYTRGGRGGAVIKVTNLEDAGPGSLRHAIRQKMPRTVVFEVSGTIPLESELKIKHDQITIAGQTAPGDGITLKNYGMVIDADEVIVRYVRSRPGDEKGVETDAISIKSGENIIIDHCSASWATDETLSVSPHVEGSERAIDLVTVQWCIISESLNDSVHSKGKHGYGSLVRGSAGGRYTFHHNLWAHHKARMPRPGNYVDAGSDPVGPLIDFRNNVFYNWGSKFSGYNADTRSVSRYNFVNNYYIAGVDSGGDLAFDESNSLSGSHFSGNFMNHDLPADPWSLVRFRDGRTIGSESPFPAGHIDTDPAPVAFKSVLESAGASIRRDSVDQRVISGVQTSSGKIIDDQASVGGWPELKSVSPKPDRDGDGMPDMWESSHGLDPDDPADGSSDRNGDGYTNLEEYINGLVATQQEASEPGELPQAPADRLLTDDELVTLLNTRDDPKLESIVKLHETRPAEALKALAGHFREAFSRRYYFDWKGLDARFGYYAGNFPSRRAGHLQNTGIHMGLYPADAQWKLPYKNLKGNEVTAYELRHLARQHKVLDMAFVHLYEDRDPVYVDYFTEQMRSLNRAFAAGEYEDDEGGNGVYEVFRAGYRVLNWWQIHAFFLGSEDYGDDDQLELIRTMLHLGASLHSRTQSFRYGNHQTRGAVALAIIAILLRDYTGTDQWFEDAIAILGEHLEKEVNVDGFQFERSIHYHVGDIYNFFRVLQLAQLNDIEVPEAWRLKLKGMFEAMVVLARPDRRLPVFQDDTDQPWAEYNLMDDVMLLGAILFDDPEINYFASESVGSDIYWLLPDKQIEALANLERKRPAIGSSELPDTGYYVMRDGWDKGDLHMAITAGLSEHKPDHQHGDMLGLVARANEQEILPNYQVRYSLPDFEYFKNSFVKNVALVDDIPHGIDWRSNRGGSGFGKWGKLPQPSVIAWVKRDDWDFFAGTHDGYDDIGVKHYRKVLFLKGLGWIVRDLFESSGGEHAFQQVWQGHYSDEGSGNHHRSTFADGSGLEILQLGQQAETTSTSIKRGKGNLVYSMSGEEGEYTTLLYPFGTFDDRIPDAFFSEGEMTAKGWTIRTGLEDETETAGFSTDARLILENANGAFLFSASQLERNGQQLTISSRDDLYVEFGPDGSATVTLLGHRPVGIKLGSGKHKHVPSGSSIVIQ